jgi:hypothetical protein
MSLTPDATLQELAERLRACERYHINSDYILVPLHVRDDAAAALEQEHYASLEHEHLGCHVAKTGIYAQSETARTPFSPKVECEIPGGCPTGMCVEAGQCLKECAPSAVAPTGAAETFYKERCLKLELELAEANRDVVHLHECLRQAAMQEDSAPSSGAPIGYAVVMENGEGPFVGCYRSKDIAEECRGRQPASHNDVVIPVYASLQSAIRGKTAEEYSDTLNQLSGPGIRKT